MLASDLTVGYKPRPMIHYSIRKASLEFLASFRQQRRTGITLRSENIGPNEPAYLVTERPNGMFKLYSIDCPYLKDAKTAFTDEERKVIIDAIPMGEEFVSIERKFTFDLDEDSNEITALLGNEWLFAIWVDEQTQTYMVERNEYLGRESDITPMLHAVGRAFRMALADE